MKILVIGGAGYIGSHVAREFLDNGHRVTVYDNLSSGLRENIFGDEEFVYGDIMNYAHLSSVCRDGEDGAFDAIVHLAAFKAAGESMVKPEKYSTNNIAGTINILNGAVEAGIKNIIFSSSATVYGEPEYFPLDEEHPTNPENYYGFTKLEIERFLAWYERLKGIRFAALRYFNAAGYDVQGRITGLEINPANLIPIVLETAAGMRSQVQIFGNDYPTPDGTCIRDYIHVSDLARGHRVALEYIAGTNNSLTVNLGSEAGLSVLEIVDAARKITGKEIPATIVGRRAGDPAKLTASARRAQQILGWSAQYSDLDTLIKSTWNRYNRH
jgi:UDP-glucose 4-epimerase